MKFVKRRALSVFLAILLFTLMVPLQAFATETNPYEKPVGNAEFTVSTSFCASGETTKLFVDISEGSQMSAGMFVLDYDTSLLRATNVETGVVLKDGHTSKNITESGQVKVSYADVNPSYDAGRIFEVEFEAVGDLPEDQEYIDIPINLNVTDLRNYEDYKIATTVNNGKITLINTPYGDVNKSGDITASDALMALYSNSQLVELDEDQKIYADVNGDSKVSAADALLILRYSAGDISNYPIFTLGIPQNLRVEDKAETYVTLAWDEVANAIGYNVYMDGVKVSESVVTELSYTVDGLEQIPNTSLQ